MQYAVLLMTCSGSLEHHEDARAAVSDAEVMTIALAAMLYFGGNFERVRLVLHELGLIKRLLSRSRLNRRLHRLSDLVGLVFHQFGSVIKDLNFELLVFQTGIRFVSSRI